MAELFASFAVCPAPAPFFGSHLQAFHPISIANGQATVGATPERSWESEMYISRLQVEEGFLDGLDLHFKPGLITLIGARGTGKTSVIELIRFCLNVPGYTPESSNRSRDHALSVLGSGQVTVTLNDGGREVQVTRTAAEEQPRRTSQTRLPIIFSQTEIENVGLRPGGRLRLLDSFLEERETIHREEAAAVAEVRSLTLQIATGVKEIDELQRRLAELPTIISSLEELAPKEQALSVISAEASAKSASLASLTERTSRNAVARDALESLLAAIKHMGLSVQQAVNGARVISPVQADDNPAVAAVKSRISRVVTDLNSSINDLSIAWQEAFDANSQINQSTVGLEEQARQIRKEIEGLQAGAGTTMRQGQQLREKKAQLEVLSNSIALKRLSLAELTKQRDNALDQVDAIRGARFQVRQEVVRSLNASVGPRIRLRLNRSGQTGMFSSALMDNLRGSGLRYADLADVLAKNISPRELLEAVEISDINLLAEVGQISTDRSLKVISSLKDADLGTIATTLVEDDVCFELLDGGDYKDISNLSTGQRCTVILPIVLQHKETVLIVDQPEDHIDNAFIVDTLIKSVLQRDPLGQIVFSTHNANIPVLGEADLVVEMDSDGRRGFARLAAPLHDQGSVDAISTVMEGGVEAFQKRAHFYEEHQPE